MAVLKDDAYGHGAVECAKTALAAGADRLAVAFLEEAIPLRLAGIAAPIHVIGALEPSQAEEIVTFDLIPSVSTPDLAKALSLATQRGRRTATVHVKIDVGLGRLGACPDEAPDLCWLVNSLPGLRLEGIYCHLSCADEGNAGVTQEEYSVFRQTVMRAEVRLGSKIPLKHIGASTVTIEDPGLHLNMVRPGLALYGYYPSPRLRSAVDLLPVMQVKTRVTQVRMVKGGARIGYGRAYEVERDGAIATVPIGSGDGYDRRVARTGYVLLRGAPVKIAGAICLDASVLDTTALAAVTAGEEVVVLGEQRGSAIWADTIADWIGTIPDTVLCGFSARVPRLYV